MRRLLTTMMALSLVALVPGARRASAGDDDCEWDAKEACDNQHGDCDRLSDDTKQKCLKEGMKDALQNCGMPYQSEAELREDRYGIATPYTHACYYYEKHAKNMEVNSGGVKFGTSDGFLEFCHDHDVVRDKQCEDRYHGCRERALERCRQDPGDDEGGGY